MSAGVNEMKKAIGYARISGQSQNAKGKDGLFRQSLAIAKYAKHNNLELVELFEDVISGTTAARPGLGAMLDRLASNGVKIVLIERTDRLVRDSFVFQILIQQFKKLGVKVVCAENGQTLAEDESPTGKLLTSFLVAIAEFEKNVIVEKLRAARQRKRQLTGKQVDGRKPFGEKIGESETLEQIKKLCRKPRKAAALSFEAIARKLNDKNIQTRYGKRWIGSSVRRIAIANGFRK